MSADRLFDHMAETHELMLLESELNDIRAAVEHDLKQELRAARAEVDSARKRIAELEGVIRELVTHAENSKEEDAMRDAAIYRANQILKGGAR